MILMSAVLAVVAIVALVTTFSALNTVTVCGEKFNKNEKSVYLFDKTVTADDMKAILKMGKLESLTMCSCT